MCALPLDPPRGWAGGGRAAGSGARSSRRVDLEWVAIEGVARPSCRAASRRAASNRAASRCFEPPSCPSRRWRPATHRAPSVSDCGARAHTCLPPAKRGGEVGHVPTTDLRHVRGSAHLVVSGGIHVEGLNDSHGGSEQRDPREWRALKTHKVFRGPLAHFREFFTFEAENWRIFVRAELGARCPCASVLT